MVKLSQQEVYHLREHGSIINYMSCKKIFLYYYFNEYSISFRMHRYRKN